MPQTAIPLADVLYVGGQNQIAGYYDKVYIVDPADILTMPPKGSLAVGATDAEKLVSLNGNITLKTGKKFITMDVISDSGKLESKLLKPRTKSYQTNYSCNVQYSTHNDGVLLAIDKAIIIVLTVEGEMKVLGSLFAPCFVESEEAKNSSAADAEKMISLKFTCQPFKPFTYSGTIQLTPAA